MRNNQERLGSKKSLEQNDEILALESKVQNSSGGLNLNFVAPTEFIELPSQGKFYPDGHPLRDVSNVEIKQMTAKEEDILTNRSFIKKGVALERLLESLIVDKRVNPGDMLISDRNAILVSARISAYGKSYVTSIICPSCQTKTKYTFDLLEKLEESLEEDQEVVSEITEQGTFYLNLPSTGWKIECRALSGHDEKKIVAYITDKTKENMTLMQQLNLLVVSINGVFDRAIIEKALEVMPASDSRFLRKEYDKRIPGLDLKNTFTCKSCDHEEVMEVPLTAEFFWPK
jgi:hypothetical protein